MPLASMTNSSVRTPSRSLGQLSAICCEGTCAHPLTWYLRPPSTIIDGRFSSTQPLMSNDESFSMESATTLRGWYWRWSSLATPLMSRNDWLLPALLGPTINTTPDFGIGTDVPSLMVTSRTQTRGVDPVVIAPPATRQHLHSFTTGKVTPPPVARTRHPPRGTCFFARGAGQGT
jgi:hypothetical protein